MRAEEVFAPRDGVLELGDVEALHDMRVATRRLRAVLEIFSPCFSKREHRRTLREVKSLADALGERRDLDVQIASIERIGAELPAADRPGTASFVEWLRGEQSRANERVAQCLDAVEREGLRERLETLAAGASAEGAP